MRERGDDARRGEDASCSVDSASVAGGTDVADDVGVLEDGVQVRPAAKARRHGVAHLAQEPVARRKGRVRILCRAGAARLLVDERAIEEPLDDPKRDRWWPGMVDALPPLEEAHVSEGCPVGSVAEPVAQVELEVADVWKKTSLDRRFDGPPPRRREELGVHDARRCVSRARVGGAAQVVVPPQQGSWSEGNGTLHGRVVSFR